MIIIIVMGFSPGGERQPRLACLPIRYIPTEFHSEQTEMFVVYIVLM